MEIPGDVFVGWRMGIPRRRKMLKQAPVVPRFNYTRVQMSGTVWGMRMIPTPLEQWTGTAKLRSRTRDGSEATEAVRYGET